MIRHVNGLRRWNKENEVVFDGKVVRREKKSAVDPEKAAGIHVVDERENSNPQPENVENLGSAEKQQVSLADIATASMCGNGIALEATVTNSSPISPPPFMVGAAEVEVDLETGEAKVIDYAAAVDCGTPVNPNLARVQAEGGILQGIGMALTENITYNKLGKLAENSLMQYKIPTRVDIGKIRVDFESSYENEGPFGAKSIGEVVINTPLPAVADAIYNATGTRFYELPITPDKIAMAVLESK